MNSRNLLAAVALSIVGCGNEMRVPSEGNTAADGASPTSLDEHEEDTGSSDIDTSQSAIVVNGSKSSSSGGSDYFNCFQAGNCSTPALSNSKTCQRGRDYSTTIIQQGADVVVVSFHGGGIEAGSSELATEVADKFGWSHYSFTAHPTSSCLGGQSVFARMHITATNFDDPEAVSLVTSHKKAIAIHGYSNSRGNSKGTICVGGANSAQGAEFINYMGQHKASAAGYSLTPVNAAAGKSSACSGLTGTASKNLVNRTAAGQGGLQLEMSDALKVDLLNQSAQFDGLRTVFYGAIESAMSR